MTIPIIEPQVCDSCRGLARKAFQLEKPGYTAGLYGSCYHSIVFVYYPFFGNISEK